jgi:membrane protease YdiL (CAAX protease family)
VLAINVIATYLPVPKDFLGVKEASSFQNMGVIGWFFLSVVVAPLFETATFQFLVIVISKYLFNSIKLRHYIYPVLTSSLLFGLNHSFCFIYFLSTFLSGFIYAFAYMVVQKRKENPFFVIGFIHALYNFVPFSQEFLL